MTTTAEPQSTAAESEYVELSSPTPFATAHETVDPFFNMFLTERRRSEHFVTRADQGIIAVGSADQILLQDPEQEEGKVCIADEVVVLSWEERGYDPRRHFLELQLLPGEARSLAAALIRGADLADFPE
ncbi:MAG: hypothetical protein M3Y66_05735 [Actinomycetota bacterium]|nr:hypothetical protein [Actinomycetota bacterium]